MEPRQQKLLVEKALGRAIISGEQANALDARIDAAAREGRRDPFGALLAAAGLDPALADRIDDRALEGKRLGGFELGQKLGEGGMGAVYRARQVSLEREVAVKVLDALAGGPELAVRFRREAMAAARLDHSHVVAPIDFGEEGGLRFFAMELMEGGSLADRIVAEGRLPERAVLELLRAIGLALEYARELGLVHRDVKPDNVLFTRHGVPKLGDLGIIFDRQDAVRLTTAGLALGSPYYIAPEAALTPHEIDHRADLYSLGVTAFECLAGHTPFDAPTALAIVMKQVREPLPDLRPLRPELGEATRAIVERLCRKDRKQRFASGGELVKAVEEALRALDRAGPHATPAAPIDDLDRIGATAPRGSPKLDRALLRIEGAPGVAKVFAFAGTKLRFGRARRDEASGEENDVLLRRIPCRDATQDPENWAASARISSFHGEIEIGPKGAFLLDKSRHGTWIDGREAPKGRPVPLAPACRLALAEDALVFEARAVGGADAVVLARADVQQRYLLIARTARFGAAENAAIPLAAPGVAPAQFALTTENGALFLEHLAGTGGPPTVVDGDAAPGGVRVPLAAGTRIECAGVRVALEGVRLEDMIA